VGIRDRYVTGVQTCALPISSCSSLPSRESADGVGAAEPETAAAVGAEAVGAAGAVAEVGARNGCGVGDAGDSASAEGPKLSTSSAAAPSADAPAVARLRRDGVSSSMRRPPASGVEVGPDADGGGPRASGTIGTSSPVQVLDVTAGLPVIPSRA